MSVSNFIAIDPIVVKIFHYEQHVNLMVALEEESEDH